MNVSVGKYIKLDNNYSNEARELIAQCFLVDPNKRLSVFKILNSKYFINHNLRPKVELKEVF